MSLPFQAAKYERQRVRLLCKPSVIRIFLSQIPKYTVSSTSQALALLFIRKEWQRQAYPKLDTHHLSDFGTSPRSGGQRRWQLLSTCQKPSPPKPYYAAYMCKMMRLIAHQLFSTLYAPIISSKIWPSWCLECGEELPDPGPDLDDEIDRDRKNVV